MNVAPPTDRLRMLVERQLGGSLNRVEMAELEDLLRDPAAMDYYLEAVEIEAGLFGQLAQEELDIAPAPTTSAFENVRWHRMAIVAAAAVVMFWSIIGAINLVGVRIPDHGLLRQ